MLLPNYEGRRCAAWIKMEYFASIDRPFDPIRARSPCRCLKKRKATGMSLTPELSTEARARLCPLLRAATRSRQMRSTFSTSSQSLIAAFLTSNIGKNLPR